MMSTMKFQSFKYNCLTLPDSFRLILLQPSDTHSSELRCSLLHTTLSRCDRDIIDHYTALSYVWGDASQKGSIYIDGHRFTITATLDAALRDLRDADRVLRIWADALCIDQSNLTERSSQVGLMAQIYSTAQHTVIHLGPLTSSHEIILKTAPSNTSGSLGNYSTTGELVELAVNGLLRLPWFSRVWIFQELILSRDVWVQCGSLRARWTDLCTILLAQHADDQIRRLKELKMLADMNYARGPSQGKMIVHLTARRGLGATDPRDFIFAHMGLASDLETLKRHVKIDYTKTCAAIYEDTARFLLQEVGPEGPVKFFPLADTDLPSKIEGLASWAPDWSIPSPGLVPMYAESLSRREQLNPRFHYAFVSHPLVLAYVGYEVDIVTDLSLTLPDPSELDDAARKRYQESADELEGLYGQGAWWSGDETGQHRHVDLRGKEEQHERLSLSLAEELLHILVNHLESSINDQVVEVESYKSFLSKLKAWLDERAKQDLIMVGSDSDGMESLIWLYLRLADYPAVLTGRRLVFAKSGRVGVVPKQTRIGDHVVFLAGSVVSLVLRPEPQELGQALREDIVDAFEERKNDTDDHRMGSRLPCDMAKLPVKKCSLVGECYVADEVGWKFGHVQSDDYTIYALR